MFKLGEKLTIKSIIGEDITQKCPEGIEGIVLGIDTEETNLPYFIGVNPAEYELCAGTVSFTIPDYNSTVAKMLCTESLEEELIKEMDVIGLWIMEKDIKK